MTIKAAEQFSVHPNDGNDNYVNKCAGVKTLTSRLLGKDHHKMNSHCFLTNPNKTKQIVHRRGWKIVLTDKHLEPQLFIL